MLPCLSKVFEGVVVDQPSEVLQGSLSEHIFMSGFRKGHSYENVLNAFTENCKSAIDNNSLYGAILTCVKSIRLFAIQISNK